MKRSVKKTQDESQWTGRDLNPRPLPCEGSDLPADLPALKQNKNKKRKDII